MKNPFTNEDKKVMRQHNVPYSVAYARVNLLKWDKQRAITEELNYSKTRRKERQMTNRGD